LRIGPRSRSVTTETNVSTGEPSKSRRAAALIIGAFVLLAAFVVGAPYLSNALKEGYSIFSQLTTTGPGTQTTTDTTGPTSTLTPPNTNCSSVVSVRPLAAPDIRNGSANITYPSVYCDLVSYTLTLINADRAANGSGPVTLDFNQAAQQHADSMLYYGYFSHFDTQGLKPYMRYSLLGGRGADFENVAFFSYSANHFTSIAPVEEAIKVLERSMVYNDSACCNNGHRYNILDPLHNKVSIGVAYNGTHVYFDEEFENLYINLNFGVTGTNSSNPEYVTMTGAPTQAVPTANSIYIAFDDTPLARTITQLNNGPHEYGPGTLEGGVLPKNDLLGGCAQFQTGTTVCADKWTFSSTQVDIAFPLQKFRTNYGPGVYTIYMITGSSTSSALTTISVFIP
jgi:uncharacterized protein YkwD